MMLKQTLLASATAGLIAAGALAATTGSAAAHGTSFQFGNNGVQFGYNVKPRRVCKPIFQRVHWRDRWGRRHVKRVQVGQRCHPRRHQIRRHRPHNWGHQNNGGFTFQFGW